MEHREKNMWSVILILLIAFIFQTFMFWYKPISELKKEAIERDYAEYNSSTGEWQWKK